MTVAAIVVTLPIVAPCATCIHDRVCAIKGLLASSKVTLSVSILAPEVTPRALPDQVGVDCSEFLDAALSPDPDQVVAAAPATVVPTKPTRPVRPMAEVMVPCEPGCGVLIPTSAVGAHRRTCEAVAGFKAGRVRYVDVGEWPRPLPTADVDVVAARDEFESRRATSSRAAAAATWERSHAGEIPLSSQPPISSTEASRPVKRQRLYVRTPETRERMRLAQIASRKARGLPVAPA